MIVEVDSKCVALLCQDDQGNFHPYASLIQGIKQFLHGDSLIQISHIYREANSCADILAKHGHHEVDSLVILSAFVWDYFGK